MGGRVAVKTQGASAKAVPSSSTTSSSSTQQSEPSTNAQQPRNIVSGPARLNYLRSKKEQEQKQKQEQEQKQKQEQEEKQKQEQEQEQKQKQEQEQKQKQEQEEKQKQEQEQKQKQKQEQEEKQEQEQEQASTSKSNSNSTQSTSSGQSQDELNAIRIAKTNASNAKNEANIAKVELYKKIHRAVLDDMINEQLEIQAKLGNYTILPSSYVDNINVDLEYENTEIDFNTIMVSVCKDMIQEQLQIQAKLGNYTILPSSYADNIGINLEYSDTDIDVDQIIVSVIKDMIEEQETILSELDKRSVDETVTDSVDETVTNQNNEDEIVKAYNDNINNIGVLIKRAQDTHYDKLQTLLDIQSFDSENLTKHHNDTVEEINEFQNILSILVSYVSIFKGNGDDISVIIGLRTYIQSLHYLQVAIAEYAHEQYGLNLSKTIPENPRIQLSPQTNFSNDKFKSAVDYVKMVLTNASKNIEHFSKDESFDDMSQKALEVNPNFIEPCRIIFDFIKDNYIYLQTEFENILKQLVKINLKNGMGLALQNSTSNLSQNNEDEDDNDADNQDETDDSSSEDIEDIEKGQATQEDVTDAKQAQIQDNDTFVPYSGASLFNPARFFLTLALPPTSFKNMIKFMIVLNYLIGWCIIGISMFNWNMMKEPSIFLITFIFGSYGYLIAKSKITLLTIILILILARFLLGYNDVSRTVAKVLFVVGIIGGIVYTWNKM
jgi:hypothetical protein